MLIDSLIEDAKLRGKLIPARPTVPWAGEKRAFLMCVPLHDAIQNGREASTAMARLRWAQLIADIGHFVEGGLITKNLMKQLDPSKYEHWELISRKPKPSLRIFGRFAKPDVFIGTHVVERVPLGGKWSDKWEQEKLNCEDHWNDAGLKNALPFSGKEYHHYITENAHPSIRLG